MALTQNHVNPAYSEAAAIFERYASAGEEAQLAVYVGGELVLDLASNINPDSVMTVYSVSKALSAMAVAKLVERGQLDLDATVASYWPEFAAKGKQDITVRQLLSHQAGLPEAVPPLTPEEYLDDHAGAARLAAQLPLWFPGKAHGYHGLTIGVLISELVFRITGMSVQKYYEAEIRSVAGADAFLGLPEELEHRVAELLPMLDPTPEELERYSLPKGWRSGPYGQLVFGRGLGDFLTTRAGRAFGVPAAGGTASARGLAKLFQWATGYGSASGGISADVLERFSQLQAYGLDAVLDVQTRAYGVVFMKPNPMLHFGSYAAFGHDGAGGAMVMADPEGEIVLGYTVRRTPFPGGMDPRLMDVIDSIRQVAVAAGPAARPTSR